MNQWLFSVLKAAYIVAIFGLVVNGDVQPRDHRQYQTFYFTQKVDHFGFSNDDNFQQKYLVSDKYWDNSGGPIFFYTGNEGAIELFSNNTGSMWEWAPEFSAMVVFAEHRYYGESLPYGNKTFDDVKYLGYLTAEQALADFVILIDHLKATIPGAGNSPVVAFGGSYGGMLAAWLRMKYPHAVVGSLAASAPIWQFGDLVPCGIFNQIVTKDFTDVNPMCSQNIRKSWEVINRLGKAKSGRDFMSRTLGLCKSQNDTSGIKDWLSDVWGNLAMIDYPYSASFLEPLPAWPIKVVCSTSLSTENLSDEDMIRALRQAVDIYFNYTGSAKCYKIGQDSSSALGTDGWTVQTCLEMVMPMCSDGVNDMFEPSPWDLDGYIKNCQDTYKLTPRPDWIIQQFGGKDIADYSNIIFSNGKLDPWSGGGVMTSITATLVSIVIEDGAHHLDLRASHPDDPPFVILAREKEKAIIRQWINEYNQRGVIVLGDSYSLNLSMILRLMPLAVVLLLSLVAIHVYVKRREARYTHVSHKMSEKEKDYYDGAEVRIVQ